VRTNTKHLLTVAVALMTISSLSADEWRGFRGLEKDSHCDSATGPLCWSSSQNVVWKTAIPGRGHSSPILSGNKVYLTTTYEKSASVGFVQSKVTSVPVLSPLKF